MSRTTPITFDFFRHVRVLAGDLQMCFFVSISSVSLYDLSDAASGREHGPALQWHLAATDTSKGEHYPRALKNRLHQSLLLTDAHIKSLWRAFDATQQALLQYYDGPS